MFNALFTLTLMAGIGHAHEPGHEPWVEAARARFAAVFPDFMSRETLAVDEGLVLEVRRLNEVIPDPVARLNFHNLLTKIWVSRSPDYLGVYHARLGSSPRQAYPYLHGIELTPEVAREPAGRVILIELLSHGFDRVTGFGRRAVPGVSWTGVMETRGRRAALAFIRHYVPPEQRWRWTMDYAKRLRDGDRGFRDLNLKMFRRFAAASGLSTPDLVMAETLEHFGPRIACEMGLWRRYDPVRDRDRLLEPPREAK